MVAGARVWAWPLEVLHRHASVSADDNAQATYGGGFRKSRGGVEEDAIAEVGHGRCGTAWWRGRASGARGVKRARCVTVTSISPLHVERGVWWGSASSAHGSWSADGRASTNTVDYNEAIHSEPPTATSRAQGHGHAWRATGISQWREEGPCLEVRVLAPSTLLAEQRPGWQACW